MVKRAGITPRTEQFLSTLEDMVSQVLEDTWDPLDIFESVVSACRWCNIAKKVFRAT